MKDGLGLVSQVLTGWDHAVVKDQFLPFNFHSSFGAPLPANFSPTTVCVSLSSYQRKYPYKHVANTLCQPPTRAASETQYFFVDVSTLSSQGTNYQLRVSRVESFTLQ